MNTISYDRAGYGYSEKCRDYIPRHISNLTIELHLLLQQANLPKPYILVGHGLGTMIARMYLAKFGEDVQGVVLLDPIYERSVEESGWMKNHSNKKNGALVKAYLARHGMMEWIVNLPFTTKAILNDYPDINIQKQNSGKHCTVREKQL
jgi:pimeloyl-ACP methyl ester carboxylesterase